VLDVFNRWEILVMRVKRKNPTLCVLILYCKNTVFNVQSKLAKAINLYIKQLHRFFLTENFLIFGFNKNNSHYGVLSIISTSMEACNTSIFLTLLNYGQILRRVRTAILQSLRERGKPQQQPCGRNGWRDPAYDMEILTD
jgi:hypothetical protein